MEQIAVTCPECGRENVIVAVNVPRTLRVGCSHCKGELGAWAAVRRQAAAARKRKPPAPPHKDKPPAPRKKRVNERAATDRDTETERGAEPG